MVRQIAEVLVAWIVLIIAGLLEICWAVGMKYSENFSRPRWSVFTVAAMIGSMAMLWWAVGRLPLGTAYAVWTGIGAAGTAILGMYLFNESTSTARLICIAMVICGVIGLRVVHA